MPPTMIPKEAKPKQKHKKKKKKKTKAPPLSFSSLPDEITENILARISKWSHPNLSLVSKRFLSILSSPELYTTRSRIGTTEPCLYFCLEDPPNIPSPQWFTLWMKSADETLTHDNDILEDYSLVPLPYCPTPHHVGYPSTVFVGSDIYLIGGPSNGPPSSLVSILDCQSHTWRDGPSMSVARAGASAYLIHGKIYVMEKCRNDDNWMEVLDIKTQTWSPLLSHGATEFRSDWFMINVCRGKIYAVAKKHYAYDPKEGTWEVVKRPKKFRYENAARCVIKNVRYSYTSEGFLMWYDCNTNMWTKVKGLDLELFSADRTYSIAEGCVLTICNHEGKLLVMWVPRFEEHNGKLQSRICCAKIALEKCNGNEVWGKIEWGNEVLTVTSSYKFLSCVVSWI